MLIASSGPPRLSKLVHVISIKTTHFGHFRLKHTMFFLHHALNTIVLVLLSFAACRKPVATANEQPFASKPSSMPVMPGIVDEASGMADSYTNDGALWVQQDSGNPPDLHLLKQMITTLFH